LLTSLKKAKFPDFYRAMLRIARTVPSQDVRLSVYPSVTRRYCIETAKRSIRLFSPPGSHAILVFFHTKIHGNILTASANGGVECKGYEK